MDCDFSVVGMVVGVHLARVFVDNLYDFSEDMHWELLCVEVWVCYFVYSMFYLLKYFCTQRFGYFFKVLDCMTRVSQFYEGEQNYRKLREQFYTQSVRPNGQGNKKSICFGLHRTYTFHSVFILAFVYCCS